MKSLPDTHIMTHRETKLLSKLIEIDNHVERQNWSYMEMMRELI